MIPNNVPIPSDWLEEDGYINILMCVPNSPQWLSVVKGQINDLARGRGWNGDTGTVTEAQAIGEGIYNSMSVCDLEIYLSRIADALDGGGQRYSIADILQALNDIDTGMDVVDFLEMMQFIGVLISKLPNIDLKLSPVDLFQLAFDVRFKASILNYLEDIALSHRGELIAQGGLPIQGIYENIGDLFNAAAAGVTGGGSAGAQWLYQVIKGKDIQIGQSLLDALNAILFGSIRDANYDIADALAELESLSGLGDLTELQGLAQSLVTIGGNIAAIPPANVTVECGTCGSSSGCNCNPEISGPVTAVPAVSYTGCFLPAGFASHPEYEAFVCDWANYVNDKIIIAVKGFALSYFYLHDDYNGLTASNRLSITQIYQRMATAVSELVDPLILNQITNKDRSTMITELTSRYIAFQDAVIAEVPEVSTLEQVITEYWTNPLGLVADDLLADTDTNVQSLFDADTPIDTVGAILTYLSNSIGAALGYGAAQIGDLLNLLATQGLGNTKFLGPNSSGGGGGGGVQGYGGGYTCTGLFCNCPKIWMTVGQRSGMTFQSVFSGGTHRVEFFVLNDGSTYGDDCAGNGAPVFDDVVGWTSLGSGDSFQSWDKLQVLQAQDDLFPQLSTAKFFVIQSTTSFSFDVTNVVNE